MGTYPRYKVKRQDLVKTFGLQPFGAFIKDGSIIPGWSASFESDQAVANLTVMGCWPQIRDLVMAAGNDGNVYGGALGTEFVRLYSDTGSSPFKIEIFSSSPYGIIISGKRYMRLSDGGFHSYSFPVELACGTMRRGRLFGGDTSMPYTLRWSGKSGFLDWTEGIPSGAGKLVLEPTGGHIIDLFDFEDELVVFRETSIMRFSTYGDPENFKEKDALPVPDIARHTMAIAGDSILFFCLGGLMRYRGGKVARIQGLITDDIVSPVSVFVGSDRYYFVCGTSKSLGRSVIYVYDVVCDCCQIIDIPAYFVSQDKQSVLAYTESGIYRLNLNSEEIPYGVVTGTVDFGTDKRKLATLLEVDCDEDVKVIISDGVNERTVDCPNGRTRLNMRGSRFTVTFCGTGSVRSAYLSAEVT